MLLIYSRVAGCLEGALRDVEPAPAGCPAFVPRKARSGHRRCPERRVRVIQRPERTVRDIAHVSNAPFRATTPGQMPAGPIVDVVRVHMGTVSVPMCTPTTREASAGAIPVA